MQPDNSTNVVTFPALQHNKNENQVKTELLPHLWERDDRHVNAMGFAHPRTIKHTAIEQGSELHRRKRCMAT